MATSLKFLSVTGQKHRDQPTQFVLQLTTGSGQLREVPLTVWELTELSRSASITLAAAVRELLGQDA